MPQVIITVKPKIHNDDPNFIRWMRENIQHLVVEHLGVADTKAELTIKDIAVRFEVVGPNDITEYDFEVVILANDYPERRKIAEEGVLAIKNVLGERFSARYEFCIWLQMGFGVFIDSTVWLEGSSLIVRVSESELLGRTVYADPLWEARHAGHG